MNAGCVRNSDVRTQRRPGSRSSAAATARRPGRRHRTRRARRATIAVVVVSSSAMPIVSASTRRRLIRRAAAAATISAARPGTRTVSVSKKCSCTHLDAARAQRGREPDGEPVHAPRDRAQTFGAVVRRRTSPAMTASSTWAVQMLLVAFSRRMCCSRVCKREPERGAALRVDRHADQAAGQRAPVLVAHREVRGVRAAEAERHPEPLRRADHRVGAHLARRRDEREREQVGDDAHQRAARVRRRSITGARSRSRPLLPGYCTSTPKQPSIVLPARRGSPTTTSIPSGSARVRTTSIVCGCASASTRKTSPSFGVEAVQHRHRLGRGRALVEQRRVGEIHTGEVADHRLEVEQRLEPALADLGLVRRVRGVPRRVLEHVAQDHRRRDRVVVAEPDQRREHLVAAGELAQLRPSASVSDSAVRRARAARARG